MSLSHYNALQLRLSNERGYLAKAKKASEVALRKVWIAQIEKEIAGEVAFLAKKGVTVDVALAEMSDDELLAELSK